MGRLIESIARARGHEITCCIDAHNQEEFDSAAFAASDVAIEFSTPATAAANVARAMDKGVAVVCGTTGWLDALPELRVRAEKGDATLFYASNYSIGMNIFMAANRFVAGIMQRFPEYRVSVHEVHHVHKLDHPSGTAITLASDIIGASAGRFVDWEETPAGPATCPATIGISHERIGEVPGIHEITWDGPVDTLSMQHSAKSREGLASGAVMAAEWVVGKRGFFGMSDMLGL